MARFLEVTRESGVDFTYRNGQESGHCAILESLGGGIGLLDYDLDGRWDLFCPGGGEFGPGPAVHGRPAAFYRNAGEWQFVPVTDLAGVTGGTFYSHGAAVGDADNDGFADILVTGYGGLLFYRNQGDGTFREAAEASGLTDSHWSSSAAWGDVNGDGCLDLYVAHYVDWSFENHPYCPGATPQDRDVCPPRMFEGLLDTLYLSNRDGTFRDGSSEAGLNLGGKGLGVLMADLDVDGWLDVYVCNDTEGNFVYRNQGNGSFRDVGLLSGAGFSESGMPDGSMGVDLGDYNQDGLPDIWVANFERESFALYRNEGNANFQHVSQSTGVTAIGGLYVGWGTVFLDLDFDGDEDIFCANGHVIRYPSNAPLDQVPLLLESRDHRYHNVSAGAGEYFTTPHMGRGVAAGDLDGNGTVDLVISHINAPLSILSNHTPAAGGWLAIRLVGSASNRDAVGAIVELETSARRQVRQRKGGASYASSSDTRLWFALPTSTEATRLTIRWPSGTRQTLTSVPSQATLTIQEPEAQ